MTALPADIAPAALHHYVRTWTGHTRELRVRPSLHARESISSGCCTPVITLVLALDDARGTADRGSVRARVVAVRYVDPTFFDGAHPAPAVGDVARLRLRDGVLHEPLTGATYCDRAAGAAGRCGA